MNAGYHSVRDTPPLSRFLHSEDLPNQNEIRISSDREGILLPPLDPDEGITLWLRTESAPLPKDWRPIPASLSGFEELVTVLQTLPPLQRTQAVPAPVKKAKWIDPKVFHY
jgi:hypothetical protein